MVKKVYIVVGVYDTMEYLELARTDDNVLVYAFEPNPVIVKHINDNINLPPNYFIVQAACSDFNGKSNFNICSNASCSSLKKFGNGPTFGDMIEIECDVLRLEDFFKEKGIKEVEYLHIDAQGSDFEVIKGLGNSIFFVRNGQCESLAPHVQWQLYENQVSYEQIRHYLDTAGFVVTYQYNVNNGCPGDEVNISFENKRLARQVGILIMRDENDILEEYLNKVTIFYDRIYVLDGTLSDEGREICAKFEEVVFYAKDDELINENARDWIRGYLWEMVKRDCEENTWVAMLHPDEFPSSDVIGALSHVNTFFPNCETVMVRNIHYFPHVSQKENWKFEKGDSIEGLLKWAMLPGHLEFRYIKLDKTLSYHRIHSHVLPVKGDYENYVVFRMDHGSLHHKHFTIRNLEQLKLRCKSRLESAWHDWYVLLKDKEDIFFEELPVTAPNESENEKSYSQKLL